MALRRTLYDMARRMNTLRNFVPRPIKDIGRRIFSRKRRARLPYRSGAYPEGVNVFGFFSESLGLGQGARLYTRALAKSRTPHAMIDVRLTPSSGRKNVNGPERFVRAPVYDINLIHVNPDVLPLAQMLSPLNYWDKRYNIGVWLWELEQIPREWHECFKDVDEIWAPSSFIADALRLVSPVPISVVPYGIEAPDDPVVTRETLGLPEDAFLVLNMFDLNSYAARKNPEAAIEAFFNAFGSAHERARLVLKVHNAMPEDLDRLNRMCQGSPNVIVINTDMERRAVNSLIRACDVLVSLHRSEGFGLVMAEAMYLGVPVVATNWSANLDFMNPDNSCLVDFELVPTGGAYMYGQVDQRWAQPNTGNAAQYLKRLYADPSYRKTVARAGMESIRLNFSIDCCAQIMERRIAEIRAGHLAVKKRG